MNLWFDFRYAWRLLLASPGHSLVCIVVIALSVGLAVWGYVLAHSQAWKALPFPSSERWLSVQVAAKATFTPQPNLDQYTYQSIVARTRSARHLGAFALQTAVLSESQASVGLRSAEISPSLLSAMQVPAFAGRLFDAEDGQSGAAPVAIISYNTWQNYFAADPRIIGRQVRLDAHPVRIVGVMPDDFFAFTDSEVWLPLRLENLARPGDSTRTLSPFIALEDGQRAETLSGEIKAAVDEVNRQYPGIFDAGRHVELIPAHLTYTHMNLQIVATVLFIAGAVLLLGCVNVSMIFLARLLERSRELALRTALGASRGRLLRQCLMETVLIVAVGLLLGYALADLGVDWMQSIDDFGRKVEADGRSSNLPEVQAITVIVAVLAAAAIWLLSTLLPAWRVARQDAASVLAGSSTGVASSSGTKTVSLLVGVQMIVSCLVLVICTNLVSAVRSESTRPMGIDRSGVIITTYATAFGERYVQPHDRVGYWEQLATAIRRRVPGATVAYTTAVPSRPRSVPAVIENREGVANEGTFTLPMSVVSEEYFALLGIRLRSGRLFDTADDARSLPVAIVDEHAVRRYWPGQEVLGKRVRLNPAEGTPWLTIVGVVTPVSRPYGRDLGIVYRPLRQALPGSFQLLARVPGAVAESRTQLRTAAFAVDRDLPLHNPQTLDDYIAALSLSFTAMIPAFTAITGITLILAATGLFGLISRSVARRTQEVGVRRALGATIWQVSAVFLRQGAVYLSVGVIGLGLGIVVMNLITDSVPNILMRAVPVTFAVLVAMAFVILLASWLPTRRATALEPGDALQYE